MPYYFYFDPTYMLVIIGLIITLIASANVNGTFRKYDKIEQDYAVQRKTLSFVSKNYQICKTFICMLKNLHKKSVFGL